MSFDKYMYITVFDGDRAPYEIKLSDFNKDVISFGRQKNCDIVLNSEYVSRVHGCIYMEGNRLIVEDMNSTNGIVCAGKRVRKKNLHNGDYVRIITSRNVADEGVLFVFSRKAYDEVMSRIALEGKHEIKIGRDADNDIRINHASVSHHHARISKTTEGYYLYDNNSTNGLLVNGKRVRGRQRLKDKDVILIANSRIIYTNNGITYSVSKSGISVEARNIVKKVGKNKALTICDNVSLKINPGELVAIVGGSGAGKSTIMNCISGYSTPTSGTVLVNELDLYENFDTLKNIIGYVPQQDIVYDNLSVEAMLRYSARLRLPADTGEDEINQIVSRVIDAVELTHRRDALIKSLSGGQKKRASIAVELLTDPNLFFLDEPSSGLDPGTERNLIRTLKGMTASGKTVILVTHSTLNLSDYDRIVFMGTGGRLCFSGSYQEALSFFATDDVVNIYDMIGKHSDFWQKKYDTYRKTAGIRGNEGRKKNIVTKSKKGMLRQLGVLCLRYLNLLMNDRQRMILLMVQAPLLAFLISLVADGKEYSQYEMTKSLLFALSCSAFWIGILSSIQEICKERNILKREYMTGMNLASYILSKVLVLGLLCIAQSLLIVTTFVLLVGMPEEGLFTLPYIEILITTILTAMAAASMGIFVSSLFTNADRAMTVAPILLMPQILFSGLIFNLKDATEIISYFAVCRWSMEGYGTTANLNALELKMQQEGFLIIHEAEEFFDFTVKHMLGAWGILLAFIAVFATASGIVLRSIRRSK